MTVFVSGCYDIIHGGHVEFFTQARALGTRLVVCAPTDGVLEAHKHRVAMPIEHRLAVLRALRMVDDVVIGADSEPGLNFKTEFLRLRPDILAVTVDDRFETAKRELCKQTGARYVQLPKTLGFAPISSSQIYCRVA